MSKFFRDFRETVIVLGVIAGAAIAALFDQIGSAMNGIMVQMGWCIEGNSLCYLRNYGIAAGIIILVTFSFNLFSLGRRKKIGKEFRELIEFGNGWLHQSRQTGKYKNRKKEWIPVMKDWDINKMQPFIKKHFGESELLFYASPIIEETITGDNDSDYDSRRSILATRLKRAEKLLEKLG